MALFGASPEKVEKWIAKGNVKKLIGALTSEDAVIRRMTAEGLGKIGGPEVLEYCRENAVSSNQEIRWSITQILGIIGSPEAVKILETVRDPAEASGMRAKKPVPKPE
jgi:HEAT repeat protein